MVYHIGLQRYRDYKIKICGKDSIPLKNNSKNSFALSFHRAFNIKGIVYVIHRVFNIKGTVDVIHRVFNIKGTVDVIHRVFNIKGTVDVIHIECLILKGQ